MIIKDESLSIMEITPCDGLILQSKRFRSL